MSEQAKAGEKDDELSRSKKILADFIKLNPSSSINIHKAESGSAYTLISNPWGDPSLSIFLSSDEVEKFSSEMSQVLLPERYSALYHTDTNILEVIFTARPLGEHLQDISGRKFIFAHRGKNYDVGYGPSSDRLKFLSDMTYVRGQSLTNHRNMESFIEYSRSKYAVETGRGPNNIGDPLSFFVSGIEWDEDIVLELVNELNFYMTYFDSKSPAVVVHSPKIENPAAKPLDRFRNGGFPAHIRSSQLDVNMMRFWMAARGADAASRFLYNYRIIEYASFSYLELGLKRNVRRLLCAPDALENTQQLMEDVLATMHSASVEPHMKIEKLLKEIISPEFLWKRLSHNASVYKTVTLFDGGFAVEPILKDKSSEKDFGMAGISAFAHTIRNIRNALSHGRDQKSTSVIAPTAHNVDKLQPWAAVVTAVAGEVIVYKDFE
ncbi:hypothetical protein [Methylorubrum extorquens]